MAQKISQATEINSFYVILSGLFRFDKSKIDQKDIGDRYTGWKKRIFGGDYKNTFDYLNHSYYDSYLNNIFPEVRFAESASGQLNFKILNHLTLLSVFSVLYDFSEWVIKMGVSREVMYPYVSITNGIIIFLLIYIIFRKGNK